MKSSAFTFLQKVADLLTVLTSFGLGYWIYHLDRSNAVGYSLFEFLSLGAFTGVLFISVFHAVRLYESKVSLLQVVETRRLLLGWLFGSLVLFAATFYLRFLDLSRLMVSFALVSSLVLLIIQRAFMYHWHLRLRRKGKASRNVAIYGAGVVGRHLFKRIYHSPGLGLFVLGFLDDDSSLWGKEVHIGEIRHKKQILVLGGVDEIEKLRSEHGLQEVFVALPNATYQRNYDIIQRCRRIGLAVSVVPPTYGHQIHNLEVDDIGGIPTIREKEVGYSPIYSFTKRLVDLGICIIAMLLLSPIFLALALIVRLDSPGPIIFRQRRIGLNGREFDFFKFRTMYVNSNPYAQTPQSSADPRITKFGKWLRRSSLDELPQFWNVLRGEMSVVGPRPEMPFIVANYTEEQRERLKVKPGITGVWQISAVRGEPIHANMEYDLFYIEHRSMLLDVIIILKTIATAIRGIGAH